MLDLAIDSRIFINSQLDAALQELDMIFNTENTELIGYPSYGTNFEYFLWQMTPSPESLKNYIDSKLLETFFLSQMKKDVFVTTLEGKYRLIYYVKITVYDSFGNSGYREYQFR